MAKLYILNFEDKKTEIGIDGHGVKVFRNNKNDEKEILKQCIKKVWGTEGDPEKQNILSDHLSEINNCENSITIDKLFLDNIRLGIKNISNSPEGKPLIWADYSIIYQVNSPEELVVEENEEKDDNEN